MTPRRNPNEIEMKPIRLFIGSVQKELELERAAMVCGGVRSRERYGGSRLERAYRTRAFGGHRKGPCRPARRQTDRKSTDISMESTDAAAMEHTLRHAQKLRAAAGQDPGPQARHDAGAPTGRTRLVGGLVFFDTVMKKQVALRAN